MKKGIIPVCLACMMLVSMCKRETGCNDVIDKDRGFEYGKNAYTKTQSSEYREGASDHSTGIKNAVHRPVTTERTGREDNIGTTVATASKKTGRVQRDAVVTSNEDKSKRRVKDRSVGMAKKDAERNKISAPASENVKSDTGPSDAGKEPRPGGLLIKPRVDVPEVK